MSKAAKLLLIPLVALLLWALPRDEPRADIAGAAVSLPAVIEDDLVSVFDDDLVSVIDDEAVSPPTTVGLADGSGSSTVTVDTELVVEGVLDDTSADEAPTGEPLTPATAAPEQPAAVDVAPTTAPDTTAAAEQAAPTTTVAPSTTVVSGRAAIAAEGISRLSFDFRSAFPTWGLDFLGPRQGLRALTYPAERRIEVFVREDDTAASIHRVLAHELGHVIDVEWNSDSDRERWREQRGLPDSVPWWPNAEAPDFATGAGDFAEAFAVLETGITTRSQVAGQPDAADLALLQELARP